MADTVYFILALLCLCASGFLAWLAWWLWHYAPTQDDWNYWDKKDRNAAFLKVLRNRATRTTGDDK